MDKIKEIINKILKKDASPKDTDKRVRINKANQQMMIAVAVTSVVFGICVVLTIHFVQYMFFNTKVLKEEDKSIANYSQTIKNSGACLVSNPDGMISDEELLSCNPDNTPLSKTAGTLRYNVLVNMAQNKNLESVARDHLTDCYEDNKRIDYTKKYEQAATDDDRELYLSMIKMCSALRVIPDALPAQRNDEALMSSLNQIFILSNWQPESLAPGDQASDEEPEEGEEESKVDKISVNLAVEGDVSTTTRVLKNIERSIRTFEPAQATISWSSAGVSLRSNMNAYYVNSNALIETNTTIKAGGDK